MTSPSPLAVSVTLDKDVYNPGDPVTATVVYSDGTQGQVQLNVTATVSDPGSGASNTASASAAVNTGQQATLPVSAQDNFGDTWSMQSNANGTAVLVSTVGTPPPGA